MKPVIFIMTVLIGWSVTNARIESKPAQVPTVDEYNECVDDYNDCYDQVEEMTQQAKDLKEKIDKAEKEKTTQDSKTKGLWGGGGCLAGFIVGILFMMFL